MDSTTVNTTRNVVNGSSTMSLKPEGLSSYIRGLHTRRPTYWDFKPSYRAVNSPGLHLHHDFRKVGKPWPPVIPPGFEGHVDPQVKFFKSWPLVIFPSSEHCYIEPEPQDNLQPTATKDGAIYQDKEKFSLPPRAKVSGNTTEGPPSANDSNPYDIDRWWIQGKGKEEEKEEAKEETFWEAYSAYSSKEEAYSNTIPLHHPRPKRSTSAVMHLEMQASMQTPSLNFTATPPLYFADEVRSCVRSSRILLDRALRTRLEDAREAMVPEQQVDLIDLSKVAVLKGNKNAFTRGPLVDLLGCSPSPRPESQNSNNTTVFREPQVDLISFGISTGQPHLRTTVPHYQQTDLLSIDSSPLLRFNEANDTSKENDIFLNFHTDDRGTSFIYQPPQKTPLKQTIAWGLLFLFFVGLARLISNAEGVELWVLVLALGLGTLVLTRVR